MNVKNIPGLLLLMLFCALPAQGGERLRFSPPDTMGKDASALIPSSAGRDALLAAVDLNGDAGDEYILKKGGLDCSQDIGCPYTVHALKDGAWITIGTFTGFNLLISDKTTYGIRDILVYTFPYNDFKSERYAWNPAKFGYEKKSD
jgi:hypothetical protein